MQSPVSLGDPALIDAAVMGDGFELSLSAVDAAVAGDLANVDDLYVAWDGSASSSVLTGPMLGNVGTFALSGIEFHSNAEHSFGTGLDAEVQLMYTNDVTLEVAIVAVLFDDGASSNNAGLDVVVAQDVDAAGESVNVSLTLADFLPADLDFVYYPGSLTHPPCTENVHWFVLQTAVGTSPAQVFSLKGLVGGISNNRPLRNLNGRLLFAYDGEATGTDVDAAWTATDSHLWPYYFETCASGGQSPIDIVSATGAAFGTDYADQGLDFDWSSSAVTYNVSNSGRVVSVNVHAPSSVSGWPLDSDYHLHKVAAKVNSEHSVDGEGAALELQFYHTSDITAATAIVAVLYDIADDSNTEVAALADAVNGLTTAGDSVDASLTLAGFLPDDASAFFSYVGSMTIPPCTEGVTWIVLENRGTVSSADVAKFQTAAGLGTKANNARGQVPTNDRTLKYHSGETAFSVGGWSYAKQGAWGELYPRCGSGLQSPIDIPVSALTVDASGTTEGLEGLDSDYPSLVPAETLASASLFQLIFRQEDSGTIGGGVYDAHDEDARFSLAFGYVHTPSEHKFDGTVRAAELQLIHDHEDSVSSVGLAITFNIGSETDALIADIAEGKLDGLADLVVDDTEYFSYEGSTTAPPCDKTVTWYVLAEPLDISASDLDALRDLVPGTSNNARSTFPSAGRNVFHYAVVNETGITYTSEETFAGLKRDWRKSMPLFTTVAVIIFIALAVMCVGTLCVFIFKSSFAPTHDNTKYDIE